MNEIFILDSQDIHLNIDIAYYIHTDLITTKAAFSSYLLKLSAIATNKLIKITKKQENKILKFNTHRKPGASNKNEKLHYAINNTILNVEEACNNQNFDHLREL